MAFDPDTYLAQSQQLEFDPDAYLGITPKPVKQSKLKIPSTFDVMKNAVAKGAAAVPDMFLNAPENVVNLGKALIGTPIVAAGYPEYAPKPTSYTLNPTKRLGEKVGIINPENEPVTNEQKVIDAITQGATGGALTGGTSLSGALTNAIAGGSSAGASQSLTNEGHPYLGIAAGLATAPLAMKATKRGLNIGQIDEAATSANSLRDKNIKEAMDAGYVFPPSQVNPNSPLLSALDVIAGGRPRMQQAASIKNQPVVTKNIAKELGLPENSPITPEDLIAIRKQASKQGYEPVRNIGEIKPSQSYYDALDEIEKQSRNAQRSFPGASGQGISEAIAPLRVKKFDSSDAVDMISQLRGQADDAYRLGNSSLGKASKQAANALEDAIESHLSASGNNNALNNFRNSRKLMAKTYSVGKALNLSTGTVSAKNLSGQLKKGAPLSGEAEKAGKAALLPGDSLADTKYATTGASQLEMLATLGANEIGKNALLLGIPFARGAARDLLLSKPVQKRISQPKYIDYSLTPQNYTNALFNAAIQANKQ